MKTNLYVSYFNLLIAVFTLFSLEVSGQQANHSFPDAAAKPAMGWNSWNEFGKKLINEDIVREVIDAMDSNGLKVAGYQYIVIDGGWRDTVLSALGELQADPAKFPHGIKALADYAHAKGFKFGLHTVPGNRDCGGNPVGGFGHEEVQIEQFRQWGVDFIKLDKCRLDGGWTNEILEKTYRKWRELIDKHDSSIYLSASAYVFYNWYRLVAQMGRTTEDISAKVGGMSGCKAVFDGVIPQKQNKWGLLSVMQIAEENNKWAGKAGNGYWNDPDMLVTGNQGLNDEEQKSHFALWCIMSAPLMLGDDPRKLTPVEKEIVLNADAIAVDQDGTEQGKRIVINGPAEIWVKKLKGNRFALLLLNRDKKAPRKITVNLSQLGITGEATIADIYKKQVVGNFSKTFSATVSRGSGLFLLIK